MDHHGEGMLTKQALWVVAVLAVGLTGCQVVPDPISMAEVGQRVKHDFLSLFNGQEEVKGAITLHEAMARALKYNMDERVKLMEEAVAHGQLDMSRMSLLPQMAASAGYHTRSNDGATTSMSLSTGEQSIDGSVSQERNRHTVDATLVWNVLDFGVGYVQAQQQADQTLVMAEQRRRVVQSILQDVRFAYWRALDAQRLMPLLESLHKDVEKALANSREMEKKQVQAPMEALEFQQGLLETLRQLMALRNDFLMAKSELARLINLKPGTAFTLAETKGGEGGGIPENLDLAALEEFALGHRPELREEDYQERITTLEVKKAMLRMLPGLEFNLGAKYDSNKYLLNTAWAEASTAVTWNLFNVLTAPAAVELAKAQGNVVRTRRQAFAMAILTQLHLSLQRHGLLEKEYAVAQELLAVHQRKAKHIAAAKEAKKLTEMEEIRRRADGLNAERLRGVAFAELQNAKSRVYYSLGADAVPDDLVMADLASVATAIERHQGEQGKVLKILPAATVKEPSAKGETPPAPVNKKDAKAKPETRSQTTPPSQTVAALPMPQVPLLPVRATALAKAGKTPATQAKAADKTPATPVTHRKKRGLGEAEAIAFPTARGRADNAWAKTRDGFMVQVGSFRDSRSADNVVKEMGAVAPVYREEVQVAKATWHQVRSGPFATREEAEDVASRLEKVFAIRDAQITP